MHFGLNPVVREILGDMAEPNIEGSYVCTVLPGTLWTQAPVNQRTALDLTAGSLGLRPQLPA